MNAPKKAKPYVIYSFRDIVQLRYRLFFAKIFGGYTIIYSS